MKGLVNMSGLDINKIIQESIQETLTEEEVVLESKKVEKKEEKKEIVETKTKTEEEEELTLAESLLQFAIAPAISAGLGALSLRNKIRTIAG